MSRNETIHTSSTGAQKAGNDERYSLVPAESLRLLARHFGRGSLKYADHNWRKGMPWSRLFDALNRHLWQFWNGEDIDAETGTPHIVAVMWHAACLAEYMLTHPDFDDRPGRVEPYPASVAEQKREPRVVELLTEDCRDAEWLRGSGQRYRYDRQFDHWEFTGPVSDGWGLSSVTVPGCGGGTFTEILPE